jgi:putative MFS transporter
MSAQANVIDDAKSSSFHRRLLVACCGGPFLDGYILSLVGVALLGFQAEIEATTVEVGLIGAASLIGIFFGALVFGALTDRIGREKMYAIDLTVLVVACGLSAFVNAPWELIVLRFIVGLAVGADYPIATSLLTEFTPKKKRGYMLGMAGLAWSIGAMVAFLVAFLVVSISGGYGLWRWLLGSGVIVGIIVVLLRRGIPESPRWLANQGRIEEAQAVMRKVYGPDAVLPPAKPEDAPDASFFQDMKLIVSGGYLKRIIMCGMLYFAQITPQYALYTFGGTILATAGITGENAATLGELVIAALFAIGIIPVMYLMESWGRRPLTIWAFFLMALPLFGLALWGDAPAWFVVMAFAVYAFVSGGPSALQWVYPNELFPTKIRATAVGLSVAFSRIGAASGTYLVPIGLVTIGLQGTMLIAAIITVIALVVCIAWAPETKGRSLEETSSLPIIPAAKSATLKTNA